MFPLQSRLSFKASLSRIASSGLLLFLLFAVVLECSCLMSVVLAAANRGKINILQQSKMIKNNNKAPSVIVGKEAGFIVPPLESYGAAPYPEYAHHHLVWINGEKQSQQGIINLVNSYLANGIPVGSVDLEAGWSTGINNFVPNQ